MSGKQSPLGWSFRPYQTLYQPVPLTGIPTGKVSTKGDCMKWFKHDSDAHRDAKLKKLIMSYGMEGYGLYWYCLELITNEVNEKKYTFSLEHDAEIIAFDTGISADRVMDIMSRMVDLDLFESSNGVITCLKLAKRLDQSMTSNSAMRKIIDGIRKQGLIEKSHDSVMMQSEGSHDAVMQEEIRLDKIRLDKQHIAENSPASDKSKAIPYQKIIDLYHSLLPALPACRKLTAKRKAQIRARWVSGDIDDLEAWESYFNAVSRSDFLMGKTAPMNGRKPFLADLEWITNETNFTKIWEGKYHG